MLSWANFPDEALRRQRYLFAIKQSQVVGRKYYLKRRQFPGHDGAPEKATTASGHDGAFRPGDAHLDGDG